MLSKGYNKVEQLAIIFYKVKYHRNRGETYMLENYSLRNLEQDNNIIIANALQYKCKFEKIMLCIVVLLLRLFIF